MMLLILQWIAWVGSSRRRSAIWSLRWWWILLMRIILIGRCIVLAMIAIVRGRVLILMLIWRRLRSSVAWRLCIAIIACTLAS